MVSLQRQFHLTPGGKQPPRRLRHERRLVGNTCDTVHVEWCDSVIPWKPCVSCKLCFEPNERPPNADLAEEDPGFCCRCKKWKATECVDGKCCRKRRGAICRRRRIPDCNGHCQCEEININAECEKAVRDVKEARFAAQRRRWRPNGASSIRRAPSSGRCEEPLRRPSRNPGAAEPFRPQSASDFSTDPYCFCNSLRTIGPPFMVGIPVNR